MDMLGYVSEAQEHLVTELSGRRERLGVVEERLEIYGVEHALGPKQLDIVRMLAITELFAAFPEVAQAEVANHIGLSVQQTRVHTRLLEDRGIVRATSRRPLRFVLSDDAPGELGMR